MALFKSISRTLFSFITATCLLTLELTNAPIIENEIMAMSIPETIIASNDARKYLKKSFIKSINIE